MNKATFLGVVGAALITFGLWTHGDAAGPPPAKIGFINLQETLLKTKAGKAAATKLESKKNAAQKKLDETKNQLDKDLEDFKKQAKVMKPDAAQQKQIELENRFTKYQEDFMQFQQELLANEREATQQIFGKAQTIVDSIAKRDGYTMIIEKNEGAVLYGDKAFDITEEVNKRLDAGEGGK
jgi:outer membrane protein